MLLSGHMFLRVFCKYSGSTLSCDKDYFPHFFQLADHLTLHFSLAWEKGSHGGNQGFAFFFRTKAGAKQNVIYEVPSYG